MIKLIMTVVVMAFACGCGTVRYRVEKPTDGRKVSTAVQWDVISIDFNNLWVKLAGKE